MEWWRGYSLSRRGVGLFFMLIIRSCNVKAQPYRVRKLVNKRKGMVIDE